MGLLLRNLSFIPSIFGYKRIRRRFTQNRLHRALHTCFYVDNKSTKWSLSLTVHVRANDRQLSVCVAMCCKYRSQRLLPAADYTRRAERYGRFCGKLRRAVHRR